MGDHEERAEAAPSSPHGGPAAADDDEAASTEPLLAAASSPPALGASPPAPVDDAAPPTIGATLVDNLEHGRRPSPLLVRLAQELDVLDRAVYTAVAATPTPTIDNGLRRLSNAADGGRLWLAVAAAMGLCGGRRGRRAALHGVTALGLAATAVHIAIKPVVDRARPERGKEPSPRHVLMPTSTSFPSGHAASGIAFANAVAADVPLIALPLRLLATATAYSRVHGGVHYPGDVIVGAVVGAVTGDLVRSTASRRAGRRPARWKVRIGRAGSSTGSARSSGTRARAWSPV